MAEITPITREEFYLAKAGGQDVPIPSAVTREEYYLEKLTNDSVAVPTPVTRREKFLYFASGGEIALPSEEKMTRLERLIAKAGGMDVSTPTAVTRLEKFWANVEGGGWKTITGVLPLTFTAKGGTAVDWVIYGNAQGVGERTAQLFDFQQFAGGTQTTTNGGLTFTRDNDTVIVNNTSIANYPLVFLNDQSGLTVPQLTQGQTYSGKLFISNAPSGSNIYIDVVGKNQGGGWTWINNITASGNSFTLSTAYDIYGYRLVCQGTGISYENTRVKFVLTKGSTAPQTYIPYGYEIPISVQGKNLFDISTMIDPDSAGKYLKNDGTTGNEAAFAYTTYIPIAAQRVRLDNVAGGAASICCYDANKNFIRGQMYYQQSVILLNTSDAAFVRFSLKPVMESNAALFGLNDYTFYIGDSPLTEGETVSKTSTGVDIELFGGENTVSTTLYNKPDMEIKYK